MLKDMYFDKKGLKELVVKRLELRDIIDESKKEVEALTLETQKIQNKHKETMAEFAEINAKINDMVLKEAVEACSETQVHKEVIIKDDKPYMEFEDFIERAKDDANKAKKMWLEHLEARAKNTK